MLPGRLKATIIWHFLETPRIVLPQSLHYGAIIQTRITILISTLYDWDWGSTKEFSARKFSDHGCMSDRG
jgi:hypothetical protein